MIGAARMECQSRYGWTAGLAGLLPLLPAFAAAPGTRRPCPPGRPVAAVAASPPTTARPSRLTKPPKRALGRPDAQHVLTGRAGLVAALARLHVRLASVQSPCPPRPPGFRRSRGMPERDSGDSLRRRARSMRNGTALDVRPHGRDGARRSGALPGRVSRRDPRESGAEQCGARAGRSPGDRPRTRSRSGLPRRWDRLDRDAHGRRRPANISSPPVPGNIPPGGGRPTEPARGLGRPRAS